MSKSGYLQRREVQLDAYGQAVRETYVQFMIDLFSIALNERKTMGKDTFGAERQEKIIHRVDELFDEYHEALEKGEEADVIRFHFDERLYKIFGDKFAVFETRYPWIRKARY